MARLAGDPLEWVRQMRRLWFDVILPEEPLHFHIVQPRPPNAEPDVAAHIILVQQPVVGFRSVLLSIFDSAFLGDQIDRFATMAPTPLAFSTLVGLAYRDVDCQDPANRCDAWVGREELQPTEARHVIDGHSVVVAVHRPLPFDPADDDVWNGHASLRPTPQARPQANAREASCSSVPVTACTDSRVPLCLVSCLPDCRTTQPTFSDQVSTLLWSLRPSWKQSIAQSLANFVQCVPSDVVIPDPTSWGIANSMCAHFDPAAKHSFELYIDGATGQSHAGWGVVVVAKAGSDAEETRCLIGVTGGTVTLDPNDPQWVGATRPDNIAAEFTALLAAQAIVLQHESAVQFCIRPDLSLSRTLSQQTHTTKAHPVLAQLCTISATWNTASTSFLEVRGHTMNPWNDLADAVAKYCTYPDQAKCFGFDFADFHALALEPHDVAWEWTHQELEEFQACMPPRFEQTVVQLPAFDKPSIRCSKQPAPEPTPAMIAIRIASINVLALEHTDQHHEVGRRQGGRTARIDAQFHAAGTHALGIQEARTASGRFQSEHYHIYASGGLGPASAQLGCELWFHKTLPFSSGPTGQPLFLQDGRIVVQIADPRRLVVRVDFDHCSFLFIVFHAPCLQKSQGDGMLPIEKVQRWWQESADILHAIEPTTFVWGCIDANAGLGSQKSQFYGTHGADRTGPQTECFESFLQDVGLYVPSTFEHLQQGPHATWSHSSGAKYRIDYIVTNQAAFQLTQKAFTMHDYDGSFTHDDHIPAVVEAKGWTELGCPSDTITWDEEALLDPVRCQAFQQALSTLPIPLWKVHPNDHCMIYETQLLALARQFFEKKKITRRRPQLSRETLQQIAMKRHVLDCGRAMNLMHDPEFKAELKCIEVQVRKAVRADLAIVFDQLLVRMQEAGQVGNFKAMYGSEGRGTNGPHLPDLSLS